MNTPVYREMVRLLNNKMNVSRNTVYNWFVKGSEYLNKVLPILKEKLLAKGAVVNCDETWCRVKVAGKYGKKYIWCMVNKEAKITVYFYDDGSRGRQVLRDFLDKTETDALQSDGFNVYMYLDKELVDVDHLCCLAHARAKFKYALEQGKDEEAEYFIRNIGRLYDLEEQYRMEHLNPEQIQLSSFYHTFIEACKMCGVSTLEYFKEFFKAAIKRVQFQMNLRNVEREQLRIISKATMQGRTDERSKSRIKLVWALPCKEEEERISTDYENMLPMTIGIKK